jgi:glutathione S-transferase
MVKLYSADRSNFAAKWRMVIGDKRLTEIEIVSLSKQYIESKELQRLHPLRKIPVLETAPDQTNFGSEVINEYLAERFSHPPLMPTDSEARAGSHHKSPAWSPS